MRGEVLVSTKTGEPSQGGETGMRYSTSTIFGGSNIIEESVKSNFIQPFDFAMNTHITKYLPKYSIRDIFNG